SHVDVRNYQEVFETLFKFNVVVKENLQKREFDEYFDSLITDTQLEQQSAFVLIFITHCVRNNNLDYLLFSDNKFMGVEVLMQKLKETNFKAMEGKPKIVIFQTSRKQPYLGYYSATKYFDRNLALNFEERSDFKLKFYINKYVLESKNTYDQELAAFCGVNDESDENVESYTENYREMCKNAKQMQIELENLKSKPMNEVSQRMLTRTLAEMKNALTVIRLKIKYYKYSKMYLDFEWKPCTD
ncbi:hypothetical protein B4U80_11924, partial [Leptotrombidium deliense]